MKYTKEERLEIGREVYSGELSIYEGAVKYDLDPSTIKNYTRLYRAENGLPARAAGKRAVPDTAVLLKTKPYASTKEYETMSRDELMREIVKLRVEQERLKKGYTVKGVGAQKVFVPLDGKSTKS